MYVRSTNINRTIMSAQYQLQGLYPLGYLQITKLLLLGTGPNLPNNYPTSRAVPPYEPITYNYSQLGNAALPGNQQLIPIINIPLQEDFLLLSYSPSVCPGQNKFITLNLQNPLYLSLSQQLKPYMKQLQEILQLEQELDLSTTAAIVDVFMVDLYGNQPIPNITQDLWKQLTFIYNITDYLLYFASQNQKQMVTTKFFSTIRGHFDSKINDTNDTLKFIFYSAHDTTVQSILAGLNLSNYQCQYDIYHLGSTDFPTCIKDYPQYATTIIFELYYDTEQKEYLIKILYNGEYVNICDTDQNTCTYSEFSSKLQASELKNFSDICQNGPTAEMINNIKKQFGITSNNYIQLEKLFKQRKSN